MNIATLQDISTDELLNCYNRSFSDYIVPTMLTTEQLVHSIRAKRVRMELSVGAFEHNKLIGFMLQGIDEANGVKVSYNAGTGVAPESRGNNITAKLYDHILPRLRAIGISKMKLEVITQNEKAIKVYRSIGYEIKRVLDCYKGAATANYADTGLVIRPLSSYDWAILRTFWDWEPSWQHDTTAAGLLFNSNISVGIYDEATLAGYLVFEPGTGRVYQFAVNKQYRNNGMGKQLFTHIAKTQSEDIAVINVDAGATATASFLRAIGLHCFIKQYEMECAI